jgi:hypothetical protein
LSAGQARVLRTALSAMRTGSLRFIITAGSAAPRFTSSLCWSQSKTCGRAAFIAGYMMGRLSCTEPPLDQTRRKEDASLRAQCLLRFRHFPKRFGTEQERLRRDNQAEYYACFCMMLNSANDCMICSFTGVGNSAAYSRSLLRSSHCRFSSSVWTMLPSRRPR